MIRIKHFPYRGKRQLTIFGGLEHRYISIEPRNEFGPRLPLQVLLGTPHRPEEGGLRRGRPRARRGSIAQPMLIVRVADVLTEGLSIILALFALLCLLKSARASTTGVNI